MINVNKVSYFHTNMIYSKFEILNYISNYSNIYLYKKEYTNRMI